MEKFISHLLSRLRRKQSMKVYDSFDLALTDSHTYEDPGVIDVVAKKTEAYRKALFFAKDKTVRDRQTIQNMFVLTYVCPGRPLNILEVGGACGAMYLELDHLLPERIHRWCVVETPSMAAAGKRCFQDDRLKFYSDVKVAFSELASHDLLMMQGVLQYTRDPLQTLEDLFKLEFDYVYITRTVVGINIERPTITKQIVNLSSHGPGPIPQGFSDRKTSQPLTIVPLEAMKARILLQYRVVLSFVEGQDIPISAGSKTVTTRMVGFLVGKIGK